MGIVGLLAIGIVEFTRSGSRDWRYISMWSLASCCSG